MWRQWGRRRILCLEQGGQLCQGDHRRILWPSYTKKNAASGEPIKTVVIKESEFKLSPSTVNLSKPGTYAFKAENEDSYQHSLEIEGKGLKSEGGDAGEAELEQALNPGESGVLTVTFEKPGTYEMYRLVDGHELEGMKGEVVVK